MEAASCVEAVRCVVLSMAIPAEWMGVATVCCERGRYGGHLPVRRTTAIHEPAHSGVERNCQECAGETEQGWRQDVLGHQVEEQTVYRTLHLHLGHGTAAQGAGTG